MDKVMTYFQRTILGMEQCFTQDKLVVLVLAVLLVLWIKEKKMADAKGNKLLLYTLVISFILLCPLTAVAVVVYQTAFYDYEWAWSMVPVLAVIAYGCVLLYEEFCILSSRKKKWMAIGVILLLLFICGNQGTLHLVEMPEAQKRKQAEAVEKILDEQEFTSPKVLWAPKNIMQEVRRQNGKILLIYGKDMWDAKSGAYDYEAYSDALIKAYDWMEKVELLAWEAENSEVFVKLCKEYKIENDIQKHMSAMVDAGVNVIVLPNPAAEFWEDEMTAFFAKVEQVAERQFTEQYVLYLLK